MPVFLGFALPALTKCHVAYVRGVKFRGHVYTLTEQSEYKVVIRTVYKNLAQGATI